MRRVVWIQVSPRSTEANNISGLPRHSAKKTDRSCRDFRYRRLSSRTARTKGSFTTGQAFKEIFCADQTGFSCAELRKQSAGSSRFESTLPFPGVARANISDQGSTPRASVPAGPGAYRRIQLAARSSALVWELGQRRQSLFQPHRQYPRLRSRPLETAPGSGRRVVAKQRLGLVSPSVSLVRALPLRARVNGVTAEQRAKNPLGVVQNIRKLTDLALVCLRYRGFSA